MSTKTKHHKNGNGIGNGESIIALLDIDCFECQVLVNSLQPSATGLPCVAISSNGISSPRITSLNYEARSFGINRSHSVEDALELCPSLVIVSLPQTERKTDRSLLEDAVNNVLQALKSFAQNQFPGNPFTISFSPGDEFYVDLTLQIDSELELTTRLEVGHVVMANIAEHIFNETALTCSAGVSTSKFRAKLAAEQNRPRGVSILHPDKWEEFIGSQEITKVPGLKRKLGLKLVEKLGLRWIREVMSTPESVLVEQGGLGEKQLKVLRRIFSGD